MTNFDFRGKGKAGGYDLLNTTDAQSVYNKTLDSTNSLSGTPYANPVFSGNVKHGTNHQIRVINTTFDIAAATLNADDGTGIHIASVEVPRNALVLGAFANVTQGSGEAGDTLEMAIASSTDVGGIVTALVAAQACNAASNLTYLPASSTSVKVGTTSSTNKYVGLWFKDVGNDAGASTALQGTLTVLTVDI